MRYGERFHAKRLGRADKYKIMAEASLAAYRSIRGNVVPAAAVDVGCSIGGLLAALGKLAGDTVDLAGIDHNLPGSADTRMQYSGAYADIDLNMGDAAMDARMALGSFDLIISQEVLEHIEPENTGKALEVFNALAGGKPAVLVFGAAALGQPGTHHVNCRPMADWERLLAEKGWTVDRPATAVYRDILGRGGISGCYYDNTQIYTRRP